MDQFKMRIVDESTDTKLSFVVQVAHEGKECQGRLASGPLIK